MRKIILAAAILVFTAMTVSAGEWTLSTEIGEAPIEALAAGPDGTVWAAMYNDNRIFHFDGTSWSVDTEMTGWSGSFWTADALDSGEVWMYGFFSQPGGESKAISSSVVAYYNGAGWQVFTAPPQATSALYAAGPNDLWLGGMYGVLYNSSDYGASWNSVTVIPEVFFYSGIAGSGPDSIWAVGRSMTNVVYAAYYNGVSWASFTFTLAGSGAMVTIPGGPPVCCFASDGDAAVYEYQFGAWNQVTQIADEDYPNCIGSAPDSPEVWIGGDFGDLYYYDGADWAVQTTFGETPYGIAAGSGSVWVSTEGRIYRRGPTVRPRTPAGDFSGDGTSDIAVFRPSTSLWAVRDVTRAYFGASSDRPVSRDYSGDGTSDVAVFRPGTGLWAARGVTRAYFGSPSDQPVPGDYRGDGTSTVAVFRPGTGLWAARGVTRAYFGGSNDIPVPGDYRGDGTSDVAVFRPASGLWAVRGLTRAYFGGGDDIPVPGDYRGDGTSSIAVFRPASGLWAVRGVTRAYFGGGGDIPVPGDYLGDGTSDVAVFRPASGLWAVQNVTRAYFGQPGDVQVINPLLPPPR